MTNAPARELHFVYITMDGGHNSALHQAARLLHENHGVRMRVSPYSTTGKWDTADWERLERDINSADFVFGCMIFGEDFVRPMVKILETSDTPRVFITSNPAVIYCSKMGKLDMSSFARNKDEDEKEPGLFKRWMQKLRPKKDGKKEGYRQTALTKNITKLMKYIPGKLRDLHTFIAMHDYWMHSSPENLQRMMALLVHRYVEGYDFLPVEEPIPYPDGAIYHPDAPTPFADFKSYQQWRKKQGMDVAQNGKATQGTVGLLVHRAVILAENTDHIDVLVRELESHGLEARVTYSALLDFRPAIKEFHIAEDGLNKVDALVNLMGFPLVGGPAGSRPDQAVEMLHEANVAYYDTIPLGFQHVEDWQADETGLNPMQTALNIALPEMDGVTEPVIYGGPTLTNDKFRPLEKESALLARRIARRVSLRRKPTADKKLSIVLYNYPPNLGNAGTAAFLDVFKSIYRLMVEFKAQGYDIELPADAEDLRKQVVDGNALQYGTHSNVGARISLDDYRRLFPWHVEIEDFWGPAPGELLTDGRDFYILGAHFGNLFVGVQPGFGYERDPMRMLMGKNASPHHGFAAFYAWLEHIYEADAVLHFGTHGALEFMPGKQVGLSADCWPHRLLGSLPNFYYYCVNNPSEGSIAKRRGASTLISYMVPPLQQAGLYKGLRRLKDSIDTYHKHPDHKLFEDIQKQAEMLGISANGNGASNGHNGNGHGNGHTNGNGNGHADHDDSIYIAALGRELIQVEHRMIPLGLHIIGESPTDAELVDVLTLTAAFNTVDHPNGREKLPALPAIIAGAFGWDYDNLRDALKTSTTAQENWERIEAIMHEALRLFVVAPRKGGQLDTRQVDEYLKNEANIRPGLLVNLWTWLDDVMYRILNDREIDGVLRSLNGGWVGPSPGNDVMRNDDIVPTGRNIHALDPYRVPTSVSMDAATKLVNTMLDRLTAQQGKLPETIAMVLWGTDNLKSDGEGIAQCLLLLGARPVEDELGNVSDVELMTLEELGRPRIDIVMTLSGIFRDLFHHQAGLLDKAVRLAAQADEPLDQNFVRKHTLEHAEQLSIPFDEAAARVYSNAPGSYGALVNNMVDDSAWEEDDELSNLFLTRKSFAYQPGGQWGAAREVMERSLSTVEAAFQNIDSYELGISDVDHYYEYLGGVTKAAEKISGKRPPVMVADAFAIDDRLSSIEQMVRLESRAKLLNPKWHESMLNHGYEGVKEIELRVSNTYGWSATADAVEGWVYDDIAETFLLDENMRERMARANPHATAAIARRLLEAEARDFWDASDEMIDQLRDIYGNLEDQMEGIVQDA
jgi:magnesium chelatase subunit H